MFISLQGLAGLYLLVGCVLLLAAKPQATGGARVEVLATVIFITLWPALIAYVGFKRIREGRS